MWASLALVPGNEHAQVEDLGMCSAVPTSTYLDVEPVQGRVSPSPVRSCAMSTPRSICSPCWPPVRSSATSPAFSTPWSTCSSCWSAKSFALSMNPPTSASSNCDTDVAGMPAPDGRKPEAHAPGSGCSVCRPDGGAELFQRATHIALQVAVPVGGDIDDPGPGRQPGHLVGLGDAGAAVDRLEA